MTNTANTFRPFSVTDTCACLECRTYAAEMRESDLPRSWDEVEPFTYDEADDANLEDFLFHGGYAADLAAWEGFGN